MKGTVLITGASGLLGRCLIDEFSNRKYDVLAQFFKHPGTSRPGLNWIQGDLSSLSGIAEFESQYFQFLKKCTHLINNYGPLQPKATKLLDGNDFATHFQGNLISAAELVFFMMREGSLRSVVNIGFAEMNERRTFRKVMPYALSKKSLLELTRYLSFSFPRIRFNMVSPGTLEGAEIAGPGENRVKPEIVARKVAGLIEGKKSGCHFVLKGS